MSVPDDATASPRHDAETAPATDHRGLRVLGFDECLERLGRTPVGRLAFVHAGEPLVFPVNHAMDGVSVVFRTSWGAKLQSAEASSTVVFQVDGYDSVGEGGWSVMMKGTLDLVYEGIDTERYDRMGLRSWADREGRGFWVRIRPVEVTGRELVSSPPEIRAGGSAL